MVPLPNLPPIRSWLYAPGNNAKLLDRVLAEDGSGAHTGGADAVILDLEDAVPPSEKARAREMVAEGLARRRSSVPKGPLVFVRVNHPDTGLTEAEIHALVRHGPDGLRVPKVESPETVRQVDEWISAAEQSAGRPPGATALVCNLESAAGVWLAREIASASERVLTVAFGSVDFARDIGSSAVPSDDGIETLYARSHVVLAARVAGVRAPVDGVYTRLDDLDGLERHSVRSRALGFFGRSALHPRQVPTINRVFTPSEKEIAAAREIVTAATVAENVGSGALRLPNGDFVDVAIVRRAEATLRLAEALSILTPG